MKKRELGRGRGEKERENGRENDRVPLRFQLNTGSMHVRKLPDNRERTLIKKQANKYLELIQG